jgi:D-psicose/D-tagatose/L-ribulose 3-epimerase
LPASPGSCAAARDVEKGLKMQQQHFEEKNDRIRRRFLELKKASPEKFLSRLNLSWSNWGCGREDLQESAKRLQQAGVPFIELHGNHYGPDLAIK